MIRFRCEIGFVPEEEFKTLFPKYYAKRQQERLIVKGYKTESSCMESNKKLYYVVDNPSELNYNNKCKHYEERLLVKLISKLKGIFNER